MRFQINLRVVLLLIFFIIKFIPVFCNPPDTIPKKVKLLVLPIVMKSPETNIGFGAASSLIFKTSASQPDSVLRTTNLQLVTLYTVRKQFMALIDGSVYFPSENYILRIHSSYFYYPDKFWGIGNYTSDASEENYLYEELYIYPQLLRSVYGDWYIGLNVDYKRLLKLDYESPSLFEAQDVPGRTASTVAGLGGIITYDSRNNAFSSTAGIFFEVSATRYIGFFGSDFNYTNYILDSRKYIETWRGQVLAMQVYGNFNAGNVPFVSLASLGNGNIMRGYYSGRFRDKNLVAAQAEYRIPLFWRLGIVGFASVGRVAGDIQGINFSGLKYAGGGGLRFSLKKNERLNIRFDYGIAHHSKGIYLLVSEAF